MPVNKKAFNSLADEIVDFSTEKKCFKRKNWFL